jgi:hypothetical protein
MPRPFQPGQTFILLRILMRRQKMKTAHVIKRTQTCQSLFAVIEPVALPLMSRHVTIRPGRHLTRTRRHAARSRLLSISRASLGSGSRTSERAQLTPRYRDHIGTPRPAMIVATRKMTLSSSEREDGTNSGQMLCVSSGPGRDMWRRILFVFFGPHTGRSVRETCEGCGGRCAPVVLDMVGGPDLYVFLPSFLLRDTRRRHSWEIGSHDDDGGETCHRAWLGMFLTLSGFSV